MGMVGPRMGQPNVNQLQNQYLSQGQFPVAGQGVGPAQPGIAQPGTQTNMAQVRRHTQKMKYQVNEFAAQKVILILFLLFLLIFHFSPPSFVLRHRWALPPRFQLLVH